MEFLTVQPRSQGLFPGLGVSVIWVSPCFGYPRTQISSVLGIPSRDTQNTESVKYRRLGKLTHPEFCSKTNYILLLVLFTIREQVTSNITFFEFCRVVFG